MAATLPGTHRTTDVRDFLPGLLLAAAITAAAYGLSQLPGLRVLGALGVALLLGMTFRALRPLPARAVPGLQFAARDLLRLGVVLLGVRLNFTALVQSGWQLLLIDLLVIATGLLVITRLGKRMNLTPELTWVIAIGSSICGASAIAAAAPLVRARERDVTLAVAVVSLLGTLGVLGFALLAPLLDWSAQRYGLVTGATLHEVAQALAAAAPEGPQALDYAALAKLTRVALLAPVLLLLSTLILRAAPAGATRPPLVPWFLAGFVLLGTLASLGLVPEALAAHAQLASLLLITAAMAAIGLCVDPRELIRTGGPAVKLGLAGFAAILTVGVTLGVLLIP